MRRQGLQNERGMALMFALLLSVVVVGLAAGAIMLSSSTNLVGRFHVKDAEFRAAADAGLEWARDTLNGTTTILGPIGVDTLQNRAPVRDAGGNLIPGYTRSVFAGRSGATSGQFGVYASVISRIDDDAGRAVVVRRVELTQESFAKFARFDDTTTSSVQFRNGIQVFGPIHTNGVLYVGSSAGSPATFWGPATTASSINSAGNGVWKVGYRENVARINMPSPADLATLSTYAAQGTTNLVGGAVGTMVYNPSLRIEFIAVDVNNDGDYVDEDEGFMRVFRANGTGADALNYVSARRWDAGSANDPNLDSMNCGDYQPGVGGVPAFLPAGSHTTAATPANHRHHATNLTTSKRWSLTPSVGNPTRRCFLGGDRRLDSVGTFTRDWPRGAATPLGSWVKWPGYGAGSAPAVLDDKNIHPGLGGGTTGNGLSAMKDYLWPINRPFNPNFKGVIYVSGSVAVSGVLRGQVTIATTGNIMLADDLTYVTAPGSIPDCDQAGGVRADILGLLTPQFFMLEDNNVNAPFRVNGTYYTDFDESADETVHAAVLTLNSVLSEDVGNGSDNSEVCVGSAVGRGCFFMVGAAIQGKNAARMASSGGGATGWNPQWTYDRCDGIRPPPYFPTTGRYFKNRYYEIDPTGFSVEAWFANNQNN
jgi:hypothetical protein